MRNLALATVVGALFATGSAVAAPIEIVARIDPGQSGPVYSWSLRISVEPGYDVGLVDLLTAGFDDFVLNPLNPGIGPEDSFFQPGDPYDFLQIANLASGVSIAPGGSTNVLLGTFHGTVSTAPPAAVLDGEEFFGGTVFDPFISPYPVGSFSITVIGVPEPEVAELAATLAAALALALGAARHRAAA